MKSFVPMGATRVVLEVIIPSEGITAERWQKDATLCPVNWPKDYSLLRAWYLQGGLYQFALQQYKNTDCPHMFEEVMVDDDNLPSRIFLSRPAVYLTQVAITQQWADMDFPNRSLKQKVKPSVLAAFEASKQTHRNNAAKRQNTAPAVYVLDTI